MGAGLVYSKNVAMTFVNGHTLAVARVVTPKTRGTPSITTDLNNISVVHTGYDQRDCIVFTLA